MPPYLVLILERRGIGDHKDFRPVGLMGSLCKLLTKVLATS